MTNRPESFMPLWIADYLADTMHLTARQHGEYLLLLMYSWKQDRPLPKVDASLRAIARASEEEWKEDKEVVLAFFHEGQDGFRQGRLEQERAVAVERFNALKAKSALGHEAKARLRCKTTDIVPEAKPMAMPEACTSHISHTAKAVNILSGSSNTDGYSKPFLEFWKAYPKTENMSKSAAHKSWKQQKCEQIGLQEILLSLVKYKAFLGRETAKQGRIYPAKHAQGWLTERRWESYVSDETSGKQAECAVEDWANEIPEWANFKATLAAIEWRAWFADSMTNGSSATLIVPSAFTAEQIEAKYGQRLVAHFGEDFELKVKQ